MFSRDNKNLEEIVNEANALLESGNMDRALARINQAISMQPRNLDLHNLKATILFSKEDYTGTLKELKFIESLSQNNAENYNLESLCYQNLDENEKALEYANKAIKAEPDLASAYYHKAMALDNMGEVEDAIKAYKEAAEKDPSNADIHRDLGSIYYDQEQYDLAMKEVKLAMRFNKADELTITLMANLQQEKSDIKGFLKTLSDAYKNTGNPEYLVKITDLLIEMGNMEGAESVARSFYDVDPDSIELVNSLATIYCARGRCEEANMLFNQYLVKNDSEESKIGYMHFLDETAQYDLMLDHLERYIIEYPENNKFLDFKYIALSAMENHEKAVEPIKLLYERMPDSRDYAIKYAMELSYLGNISESLAILEKQGKDENGADLIMSYFTVYSNAGNYDKAIELLHNSLANEIILEIINQEIEMAMAKSIENGFEDKVIELIDSLLTKEDSETNDLYALHKACLISINDSVKATEILQNHKFYMSLCDIIDEFYYPVNQKIDEFLSDYYDKYCPEE